MTDQSDTWAEIVHYALRVAEQDETAILPLAAALRAGTAADRARFQSSGAGENVYMGWTSARQASDLAPIERALLVPARSI